MDTDPSVVIDPPGAGPTIWFNRVPEPKRTKNRVHLDLNLDTVEDVRLVPYLLGGLYKGKL